MRTFIYPPSSSRATGAASPSTFRDIPEAITEGRDEWNALDQVADALGAALLTMLTVKRPLPEAARPRGASGW